MERRLLLVFALTFLVIVIFEPVLKKFLPQTPAAPASSQVPTATQPAAASEPAKAAKSEAAVPAPAMGAKQAGNESETVIENDFYRITFTNRGAQVKSWILKKYDDERGRPLDLVNDTAAAKYGYPLSLWTYDADLRSKLNSVLYVAITGPKATNPPPGSARELTFEYSDSEISVRKTFHFDATYLVKVETSVASKGATVAALPAWPAGFGDQTSLATYRSSQIQHQYAGGAESLDIKKVSGGATLNGPVAWAGISDSYFTADFLPDDPQKASLITLRNAIEIPRDPQKPAEKTPVDVLGVAVGNLQGTTSERVYAGPKSMQVLESISVPAISGAAPDLRGALNFGFWGAIARPLFIWLRWTHDRWVHNWGWAIVIQTAIIAIALLPLRISQMKSALKMQKAAPQIKALQEKYKKYSMRDPRKQEMNKEMADLYKREGVNPVGGCVPLLVQLPFIWAYYKMLGTAIDLRHAHWLWIHDLSSRDPYFILPILLVVSMILTQRMTPQAGMDPSQQKLMNWTMPLMMGFIFYNLAAGLNLYYAESNLISIAQQAIMNRTTLGQEMREMALKRARKKDKDK